MMPSMSFITALILFLACTSGLVAFAAVWRLNVHKPVRARPHLEGRRAAAYWHSPTGLQDERGIRSVDQEPGT